MIILDHYIFNIDTAMLKQMTNENGEYYTIVVEKNHVFRVNIPMQKLIEFNYNYYGLSYRGARDGSRALLGKIQKCPISIYLSQNIIWLPSDSLKSPTLHWFALHCIRIYEPFGDFETEVILTSGLKIYIPIRSKDFEKSYNKALVLKAKMEQRINYLPPLIAEQFEEYVIEEDKIGDIDLYE